MMSDTSPNSSSSSDPSPEIDQCRRALRAAAIAARETLPTQDYVRANASLCGYLAELLGRLQPACIGFCWPHRAEPDLRELIAGWLAAAPARRAALPEVRDRPLPMRFREWTPHTALLPDRHGIPTPVSSPEAMPEVLLVPLNAFDAGGYRLGYGGGYFDRTLAALSPRPLAVGVGFELGRVDSTLPQPHDHPMDWVVTEAGCFPSPAARG